MSDAHIYTPQVPSKSFRQAIRGIDYRCIEWGDPARPTFVWLHGWGDCALTFQFVVDRLARDWHVVAPDLRGFGESHGAVSSYWFPDYLADLDVLLDRLSPNEPVLLAGHSMGANIAGLYAGTMPERIRAFVNVEGFGLADSDPDNAPARYRQWIEQSREPQSFSDYADYSALAAKVRRRSPAMSDAQAEFVARAWAKAEEGRTVLRADPRHRLPNPVLYRRAEAEACWRRVTAAVLLVSGSKSPFAAGDDPRLDGSPLPFADATSLGIDGAGHMLHFEAPTALAAAIDDFFAAALQL